MISGFNTDIEFDGVVYHVQTEDKGLSALKIISLVYDGGTILASKRTPYDDLANGNFDEEILTERLQKQHKLICAAIQAGRLDDLKQMTAKASAGRVAVSAENAAKTLEVPTVVELADIATTAGPADLDARDEDQPLPHSDILTSLPIEPPIETEFEEKVAVDVFEDDLLIDGVSIVEDEHILDAEAVAVVSELSGQERPANSKLSVELLGETKFKGGDRQTVNIMVCRGTGRKVVPSVQIMIKVLGSSFRPVIFHAKSDSNGLAKVHLQLPHFQAGRAALLIRAIDQGEEIELRRVVTPG